MSAFPELYLLNGCDRFQIFLDDHHRKFGPIGNISRLVIFLSHKPVVVDLTARLNQIPLLRWMTSLRLKTGILFALPKWIINGDDQIYINEPTGSFETIQDCHELIYRDIVPTKESPIQFDLISLKKQCAFVLSWNHILMDARCAELIMGHIGNGHALTIFNENNYLEAPWKWRFREITEVKNYLIEKLKSGLLVGTSDKSKRRQKYRVIRFDNSETEHIDAGADRQLSGVIKSSYYLACVASAFHELASDPAQVTWIPVPQDRRRKGQLGPVMSNQVSFLFYALPSGTHEVTELLSAIRQQMMDQMRNRFHERYLTMMDSMRRFPKWLYRYLVYAPTNGALASLFYSDTGNSLKELNNLLDIPVTDALHIPPNCAYPGLTIIFMRFKDRLRIIYSYPETSDLSEKIDKFEMTLRKNLLNHASS